MNKILKLLSISVFILSSCRQKYHYPGQLEIKTFKIGQDVDTTLFIKRVNVYFPNYLDGWTMDNYDQLPEKYHGLPIAIWQLKSDSSIALTLLKNKVLNITVSYMTESEMNTFATLATNRFGNEGIVKTYEETHPLQEWITYWDLKTWETPDVIFQIGNANMRKPKDSKPLSIRWNLAYSDFKIETTIIANYKKNLFSSKQDPTQYQEELNRFINKTDPPETGLFTDHYKNGQLKEKGNYKEGNKEGLWESWFDNGQKEDSATYKNNELIGKRLMWFNNGQLKLESYWNEKHERVGIWTRYFANGQIESIGGFDANGEFHGKDLQFHENGNKARETIYEHGRGISDIQYNEKGKRIN